MIGANERMRVATLGATNHSAPGGRSYGDWHAEGDTPQVDTMWLRIGEHRPLPAAAWGSMLARLSARDIMFHLACCQMKLTHNRAKWRG